MTRRKTNAIIYSTVLVIFVVLLSFILFDTTKRSKQTAVAPTLANAKLTSEQKERIMTIITGNTNHYKKLWQDGQDALAKPNSSAFSTYSQTENPANDNSMNNAFKQADAVYPTNVSDDALNTWRMDTIQLSSDMGVWVNDGTSWQIKTVTKDKLNADAQKVNQDLTIVEKDIQAIN